MRFNKLHLLWISGLVFFSVYYSFKGISVLDSPAETSIKMHCNIALDDEIKLYYMREEEEGFSELRTVAVKVRGMLTEQEIILKLPKGRYKAFRLDFGQNPDQSKIIVSTMSITTASANEPISFADLSPNESMEIKGNVFNLVKIEGRYDPYVYFNSYTIKVINEIGLRPPYPILFSSLISAIILLLCFFSSSQKTALLDALLSYFFFIMVFSFTKYIPMRTPHVITLNALVEQDDVFQVFLITKHNDAYSEEYSLSQSIQGSPNIQKIYFNFPDTTFIKELKIDIGQNKTQAPIKLESIEVQGGGYLFLQGREIFDHFGLNDFVQFDDATNKLVTRTLKNSYHEYDPYLYSKDFSTIFTGGKKAEQLLMLRVAIALLLSACFYIAVFSSLFHLSASQGYDLAFISLFLIILLFPSLHEVIGFGTNAVNLEKRTLAKKPNLSHTNILDYPREYETYYNDNISFRNLLVEWNAILKANLFHTSAEPEKTMIGKNRWIFYTGEYNNVLSDIQRKNLLTEAELERVVNDIARKKHILDSLHIGYYYSSWPDKHTIYPQFLPLSLKYEQGSGPTRFDQVIEQGAKVNLPLKFIDVRKLLIDSTENHQLYLKNDTHWNSLGGFIAYHHLINRIASDYPKVKPIKALTDYDLEWRPEGSGDLLGLMGISASSYFEDQVPVLTPKSIDFKIESLPVDGYPAKTVHHRNVMSKNKLKLMVLRDSYTTALMPYLSPHFSEVLYLWTGYDQKFVDIYKPDIIIEGYVGRFSFYP